MDETVIAAAEHIMGVVFTGAERRMMAGTLPAQLELTAMRRAFALPIDIEPACRFDPRLPGFVMPPDLPVADDQRIFDLPTDDIDIAFAPVAAQSAWIKSGQLSARRLTHIYLARMTAHNPALCCYVTMLPEQARARADQLDRLFAAGTWLGPLHGIPYGCKDILDTAGITTGWGAEPYRDRVPSADAAVVARLNAAGAVLLGKTSVGALAYGDLWYCGRTRNPWNLEEGSSGSSAGSASAVGAGLAAFAIGTETLGSIVSPSTRCGTIGLRPTFGRVARTGTMSLCPSLDKIGPICRDTIDCAMVLAAINGADEHDVSSIAAPFKGAAAFDLRTLRVGYVPADFALDDAMPTDHAALAAMGELGVEMVALDRPDLPYNALISILMAEAAARFEELTLSDRDDELTWQGPEAWPNQFRQSRFLSAVDHIQLDRLRRVSMQMMDRLFAEVDMIIGPSLAGPMLVISNFTGHPCLCLPAGFIETATRGPDTLEDISVPDAPGNGPAHRVPHSITLLGRLFDEARLLALGAALQAALAVTARPALFNQAP